MSIKGFKKQVNKANQFVSEKIAGAKGTELDEVFIDMEKKTDSMEKMVHEITSKVHELLQPNPATRVKMAASKGLSKFKGHSGNLAYPQPEGNLAEVMLKYGPEFGHDSKYGAALIEAGECFREMSDEKYKLEDQVKQNFLEPLQQLESKDIREVNHHRKKLVGRRLDYDCKKRKHSKGSSITQEELNVAKDKFEESKQLAEVAMANLLDNDAEQISQLLAFVEAKMNFHRRCATLLQHLHNSLDKRQAEVSSSPRKEPKMHSASVSFRNRSSPIDGIDFSEFMTPRKNMNLLSNRNNDNDEVKAEALFDFEAENNNELDFKTGSIIRNVTRIDENWLEGTYAGRTGYFPTTYVRILSDLS